MTGRIDAGAELVRRFDKYAPVEAAFWIRPAGDERWRLYIASAEIDATNVGLAYAEVLRLAGQMANPDLDPFEVRLVAADDPLARAVRDIYGRYPGRLPTRYDGPILGGMSVEGAYLYPMPATTAGG